MENPLSEEDRRFVDDRRTLIRKSIMARYSQMPYEDRDDLVQEGLLQACRAAEKIRTGPYVGKTSALCTAAEFGTMQYHRDHLRGYGPRGKPPVFVLVSLHEQLSPFNDESEKAVVPEALIDRSFPNETMIAADELVKTLPEILQTVYRLWIKEDLLQAEIARMLGCSQTMVSKREAKISKFLRQHLSPDGFMERITA